MKIPVTLNGENTVFDVPSDKILLAVLRERGLVSVKCGCNSLSRGQEGAQSLDDGALKNGAAGQIKKGGCNKQICGACTVLLDGFPVPSCIVPVAIARDSEIITLEYFSKTANYSDIMKGFKIAGIKLCGFCDAGKIFACEYLLRTKTQKSASLPMLKAIYDCISFLSPCCASKKQLAEGIIHAFNSRVDREGAGFLARKLLHRG